ncbi:MAG: hypothetical protein AAF823_04775 [Planctomycetota bacterium]
MAVLREDTPTPSAARKTAPHATATRPGVPAPLSQGWVSEELIQDTITAWQPYYTNRLSPEDAIGILTTMGRLVNFLEDQHEVSGHEKI